MGVAKHVLDSSSLRVISRVDVMVVLRVHLYSMVLLSSNCDNIMENNMSQWCLMPSLGLPWASIDTGTRLWVCLHFHSGSCPATGDIKSLLRSHHRVRVRGHQGGQTWVPSVTQQVAIKLPYNYRGKILSILRGRQKGIFIQSSTYYVPICCSG